MNAFRLAAACLLCVCSLGCAPTASGPSENGRAFLLAAEPERSMGVVELKAALQGTQPPQAAMLLLGRVGGGQNETFDPNQATFLLRDMDLKIESHDHEGNHDDCKFCQLEQAKELASMALVRVVDENGKVVPENAAQLLGLRENQIVVAQGAGTVDEVGTFVFDATKIYVYP